MNRGLLYNSIMLLISLAIGGGIVYLANQEKRIGSTEKINDEKSVERQIAKINDEEWVEPIFIDNPRQQQCDSKSDFRIGLYAIIEKQNSLEEEYNALLKSGLEKVCPERYYMLIHGEMGSWIISTLNEPGSLGANQWGEEVVYAPSFSCMNHICAHEDICKTPRWEKYTGTIKKRHDRIKKFTYSCFW